MLDAASRQRSFPSLQEMIYLNTAAEGIPPLSVQDALQRYFHDHQRGMAGRDQHFTELEAVKAGAAELFGLSPAETAVCSCSSEAFNLLATALRLQPGDEIIINDLDYPAGITPWLQPSCPARTRLWSARAGALHLEDLLPLLGPRTRLVPVSLVSFFNGHMLDLPALVDLVHRHSSALISADVTQALGRVPLDLRGADFIVSSTHKWILGPHGGALIGIPAARQDMLTTSAGGWFHLQDLNGPHRFTRAVSKPGAASYAVGMPNFPAIYATRAALDFVRALGIEAIARAAEPLTRACLQELARLPVELLTPTDPARLAGIIAFRHPAQDALERALHAQQIHVMNRAGRIRISIHGYNTAAEIETFLRALHAALQNV